MLWNAIALWDMEHYTSFTVAYLFTCVCLVPACVMLGCVLSCLARGGSARSYSGLCSCACCSAINLPCCWYICMHKFSQLFKCVLCSVLINVHKLLLRMNVKNMHGEKTNTYNMYFWNCRCVALWCAWIFELWCVLSSQSVMQEDMKIETSRWRRSLQGACTKMFVCLVMCAKSSHKLTSVWCHCLNVEVFERHLWKNVLYLSVSLSCPVVSRSHVTYTSYLTGVQFLTNDLGLTFRRLTSTIVDVPHR
jgi:hypothetical protein